MTSAPRRLINRQLEPTLQLQPVTLVLQEANSVHFTARAIKTLVNVWGPSFVKFFCLYQVVDYIRLRGSRALPAEWFDVEAVGRTDHDFIR